MKLFSCAMHRIFSSFCLSAAPALVLGIALVAVGTPTAEAAQAPRIVGEVNSNQVTRLPNSQLPMAQAANDTGRVSGSTRLEGITIYFSRTQAQEADLQKLLAAQQNPSSPQYHKWLTPEQFGSRFGLADADIAKVQSWLEQQGFAVDSVGRSKGLIRFSGSVAQVESAFATELHNYKLTRNGKTEMHFAPSTPLSVPTALAGVVLQVHNLDNFRPHSHVIQTKNKALRPKPNFTGYDSSLYFAPGDIVKEYDIQGSYSAGNTGSGQTITIVGQSEIAVADIEAFEAASGLTIKDPTTVLMPGTGSATFSSGDETESDLDLEWSGAIGTGATIEFVYTGSDTNYGVFDALTYAVDNKIGTIISSSYGSCEAELAGYSLETVFEQAASQGQTVLSASGDDGSTDCFTGSSTPSTTIQEALAVDYPASSPYVVGVGGTEISQANLTDYETPGNGYWAASNGSTDIVTSVLQYIPEQAWNEDVTCFSYVNQGGYPLCAGGGGASTLFSKPSWQTGVSGIPADGKRDVPDIALNAAVYNPGYLFCSSDQSDWDTSDGQTGSCVSGYGYRDAGGFVTAAGGTSFAAPIFAGMLSIINQQQGYSTGQGLVNPTLYTLASNATTYASAFHDITLGNNNCDSGSDYCNGTIGFAAGTGYDQVTGLGTIDLSNLATAWPASSGATLIGTTTTVSASSTAPTINTSDTFTVTVASDSGTAIPTGTVTITVDSLTPVTGLTLTANGTVTYSTTFTTAGTHSIVATYSGDTTHATSTGSVTVNVPVVSSGSGTFTMAATNLTVAAGGSGSSTITVTPSGGYTGTVDLTFDTSNDNALANLCYEFTTSDSDGNGTVIVSNASAVMTQLSFDDNAADCANDAATRKTGKHALRALHRGASTKASNVSGSGKLPRSAPLAVAFAGLMLFGFVGRYARRFRTLAGVVLLVAVGFAISACGGNNSNAISNPPAGTYTINLTGMDSSNSTITAPASFTFTIQ